MDPRSNLVTASWLAAHAADPTLVIVDCRFDLADPRAARDAYGRAHIPRAVYFDLERDLSGPKRAHGGRHPLPELSAFTTTLGRAGIGDGVEVVAYDAQQGCMAARLWWMLRYLGHDRVRVLDGGWQAWERGGFPTTADIASAAPREFSPRPKAAHLVGADEVRRRLGRADARLVDSRAPERYRGETEPLDPVAGHIPGAKNLPWTDNQDAAGALLPVDRLRRRFADLGDGSSQTIVYCGSGVTACANLLAMDEAGITNTALYLGGWSDWCSYPENPRSPD
jgi:thiosulfate/3-mercaptopyruvate sulfurtransferase